MTKLLLALTLAAQAGACFNNFAYVKPGQEKSAVALQEELARD